MTLSQRLKEEFDELTDKVFGGMNSVFVASVKGHYHSFIDHVILETLKEAESIVYDTQLRCGACDGAKCNHTLWCDDRKRIVSVLKDMRAEVTET